MQHFVLTDNCNYMIDDSVSRIDLFRKSVPYLKSVSCKIQFFELHNYYIQYVDAVFSSLFELFTTSL